MKLFNITSSLAAGLAHRLRTIDAQVVVDAVKKDPVKAIRANLRIVGKLVEANKVFEEAVTDTETKKRLILTCLKDEYDKESVGKSKEEAAALAREKTARFNKDSAEVQKLSVANPDTIITVELSDDDYTDILLPVFAKTASLWDVEGDGGGQELFLKVADCVEAVTDVK